MGNVYPVTVAYIVFLQSSHFPHHQSAAMRQTHFLSTLTISAPFVTSPLFPSKKGPYPLSTSIACLLFTTIESKVRERRLTAITPSLQYKKTHFFFYISLSLFSSLQETRHSKDVESWGWMSSYGQKDNGRGVHNRKGQERTGGIRGGWERRSWKRWDQFKAVKVLSAESVEVHCLGALRNTHFRC